MTMPYTPKIRTVEITAPATIRTTLTQAKGQAVVAPVKSTWGELKAMPGPYIVGWNIDADPPPHDVEQC
jgi:hypothetical protein